MFSLGLAFIWNLYEAIIGFKKSILTLETLRSCKIFMFWAKTSLPTLALAFSFLPSLLSLFYSLRHCLVWVFLSSSLAGRNGYYLEHLTWLLFALQYLVHNKTSLPLLCLTHGIHLLASSYMLTSLAKRTKWTPPFA